MKLKLERVIRMTLVKHLAIDYMLLQAELNNRYIMLFVRL
jgi:hypothetical protein